MTQDEKPAEPPEPPRDYYSDFVQGQPYVPIGERGK